MALEPGLAQIDMQGNINGRGASKVVEITLDIVGITLDLQTWTCKGKCKDMYIEQRIQKWI